MPVLCKLLTRTMRKSVFLDLGKLSNGASVTIARNAATRSNGGPKQIFKLSMVGLSVGALVGTGYSIRHLNKPKGHIMNEQIMIPTIDSAPEITPSKSFVRPGDSSGLKLTLYQYQTCPFCCKVRAFLDYYGLSYDVVEVDPVLRQATKWSTYKKVPILLAKVKEGYQPLNDSSMIISSISSYLIEEQNLTEIVKYYPILKYHDEDGSLKSEVLNRYYLMFKDNVTKGRNKEELEEERKWRKWADDTLVHDLSPNVYRTPAEALQAFNWFSEVGEWERNFPAWERYLIVYVGAFAMWLIGKRLKKRHNLKEDVRESLYDHCKQWMRALKIKGTQFMGGNQPNLADLAVYGVLSSIEGCDAFGDLMSKSNIRQWYLGVKDAVLNHRGSDFPV